MADKKSELGYSKNSPYKNEPYININSNKITMKDTEKDLLGVGIKDGKMVKIIPMKAGKAKDYDFGDVDSVLEIPNFQPGGRYGGYNPFSDTNGLNQHLETRLPTGEELMDPNWYVRTRPIYKNKASDWEYGVGRYGEQPKEWTGGSNNFGTKPTQNVPQTEVDTTIPFMPGEKPLARKIADVNVKVNKGADPLETGQPAQQTQETGQTQQTVDTGAEVKDKENLGIQTEDELNAAFENDFLNKYGAEPGEGYEKVEEEETDFINPYGGVSLEEAFAGFGRGMGSEENKGLTGLYGAKAGMGAIRTFMGGYANQQMSEKVENEAERKQKEAVYSKWLQDGGMLTKEDIAEVRKFQGGGEMELSKKLTGDYVEGLANKHPEEAVAEAEDGEFIIHTDGQVVEIEGNKHGKKGGEKMTANQVKEGDRFISDHLKVGNQIAKNLSKELGFKVKPKDTYASVLKKYRKDIGLTSIIEEKEDIIKGIEKNQKAKHDNTMKLNLQFQSKKLQELKEKEAEKKESFRGFANKVYEMQENSKPKQNTTPKMKEGGEQGISSKERLEEFYRSARGAGFTGSIDLDAKDLGAEAGKIQKWMVKNKPELVVKYFTENGQPITSKGIDMLKQSSPELFKQLGLDPNKASGSYTPEERKKFTGALMESGVGDEFWLEQFNDNRWEYRAPMMNTGAKSAGIDIGMNAPKVDSSALAQVTGNKPQADNEEDSENNGGARLPNLPDQSVLPPNSMAGHLKNNYRFNRVEPGKVSPEQALAEIGSQLNTGIDQANQRPDSMKAALLAQMLAGSQGQANKAVMGSNMANQQSVNKAENYNAQVGDKEMVANNRENLRFEQMQMKAKENTDMDFRDYLDYNRRVQLNNYNTVNQMNMMNDLFDKYEMVNGKAQLKGSQDMFKADVMGAKQTKKSEKA